MDNYTIGDLTDVIRASGAGPNRKLSTGAEEPSASILMDSWQFQTNSGSNTNNSEDSANIMPPSSSREDSFGDPFSDMKDPLFHGLDPVFFDSSSSLASSPVDMIDVACRDDVFVPNMFTRMLQMSAADSNPAHHQLPLSPCGESPVVAASSLMKEIKINSGSQTLVDRHPRGDGTINLNRSKGCLMDSTEMQISSPSNSGIRRRKSQAKKVVCIPAPAAANSRASGEVVPSDLWAWRKYGQKPIKGSPYPRGYYRCSSSKGCSARKQVERSRADPNMLVITYTSEHNHPWPTQRNALAGSTRSQPSKSNNSNATNSLKGSQSNPPQAPKEAMEQKKEADNASADTTTSTIKEEIEDAERHMKINGGQEFNVEFSHSYRPSDPEEASRSDDFFADLGEIDGDPLNQFLLSHGFGDGGKDAKGLDPFGIFDWPDQEQNPFGWK